MVKSLKILLIVLCFLTLTGAGAFYFIFKTTDGLKWVTDFALTHYVKAQTKTIAAMEGTLSTTAVFKDIELKDLQGLPAGSIVRVQELRVKAHGLNYKSADIMLRNARLKLPVSENIVLDGTAKNQALDFTVFSPSLDVEEILRLAVAQNVSLRSFKGAVKDIDARINGTFSKPVLDGRFTIDRLSRPDLVLTQSPGSVHLELKNINRKKIKGEIGIQKGFVQARRTKITLKPSHIYFSGDPKDPALSIEAFSTIDTLDIDILVQGTAQKPDLKLTSDPPLSQEELMVTLATGRKWEGFENLEHGQVSSELVKELAGYLFASGSGDGFFERMGITNVKVTMEQGKEGVGFKKELSDKLDVGYEVEKKGAVPAGQSNVSQTLGADYRVSNTFFATVEQQMPVLDGLKSSDPSGVDDRLMMKYKQRF